MQIQVRIFGQILLSATVKELLKSESIGESYAQIKNGPVFLTHSVEIKTPQVSRMQSTLLLSLFSTLDDPDVANTHHIHTVGTQCANYIKCMAGNLTSCRYWQSANTNASTYFMRKLLLQAAAFTSLVFMAIVNPPFVRK